MYFIVGIDNDEDCNELAILEFIHTLAPRLLGREVRLLPQVETLDKRLAF